MSIVEKAAEKLRARQPVPAASVAVEMEPESRPQRHGATTVERLEAKLRPTATAPARPDLDLAASRPEPLHIEESALQRAGWLPRDEGAASRLADQVRRAKRPILDNINGRGTKPLAHAERIVITSAIPGEGKTFTAVNLALNLALEPDFDVLLVDADIPKSDITRVLGLEDRPGLVNLLTRERQDPADVIVPTDVPNLSVLPSGGRHPLAAELFGGRRMEEVLDALEPHGRRRLLVFDSSPLLATPEAQVLVAHMAQVLVVVGAGSTRQHELGAALEAMGESQYVGLVLNMSKLPASESHYYDHYGYYSRYQFQDR